MRRLLLPTLLLVAIVAGLALGALAWAEGNSAERIATGVRVGGVHIGEMTRAQALRKLQDRIGEPAQRSAVVRVGDRRFRLTAEEAGVRVQLGAAVQRAYEASRSGNFIERGWRALTGGDVDHDEPAPVTVDRRKVRAFVRGIMDEVARDPVDARLEVSVTNVTVSEARPGRRLAGARDLLDRLVAAMSDPRADRRLRARTASIEPEVTAEEVWDQNPVVVTVSRADTTARVFERGELVKSYRVAVGEPNYPTPTGHFEVQTMQVNPPWNVPNSDWAGDLAGQVIPGGDPRNPLIARWIGFNGAVGFHGTNSLGSLGRSASHGCVRMSPDDVIDLYERVEIGTPVIVA